CANRGAALIHAIVPFCEPCATGLWPVDQSAADQRAQAAHRAMATDGYSVIAESQRERLRPSFFRPQAWLGRVQRHPRERWTAASSVWHLDPQGTARRQETELPSQQAGPSASHAAAHWAHRRADPEFLSHEAGPSAAAAAARWRHRRAGPELGCEHRARTGLWFCRRELASLQEP